MEPFIGPDDRLVIWAALFIIVAFAMWAEKTRYGKLVGGAVIAIMAALLLSNTGVLPTSSPVFGRIDHTILPLAIPLLLFHANLNKIIKESGPTLMAFIIGVVGTVVGAIIACEIIPLPAFQAAFTGTFAATFIGGGMNFAAVSNAAGIPPGDYLAAATAADNIMTALFLLVLATMPALTFIKRLYPAMEPEKEDQTATGPKAAALHVRVGQGIFALTLAYAISFTGHQVQDIVGWEGTALMVSTVVAVLLATFAANFLRFTGNAFALGMFLMLIFFASLGARADFVGTIDTAPVMFGFVAIVIFFHCVILFGVGKLCKLKLPELITASNACILGPPTAAGLAANKGWYSLVTPGILVGTLGYALANFIGVGLANWLG